MFLFFQPLAAPPKPLIGSVSPEIKRKIKSLSADSKGRRADTEQKVKNDGVITARSSSAVEYTPVELIDLEVCSIQKDSCCPTVDVVPLRSVV